MGEGGEGAQAQPGSDGGVPALLLALRRRILRLRPRRGALDGGSRPAAVVLGAGEGERREREHRGHLSRVRAYSIDLVKIM